MRSFFFTREIVGHQQNTSAYVGGTAVSLLCRERAERERRERERGRERERECVREREERERETERERQTDRQTEREYKLIIIHVGTIKLKYFQVNLAKIPIIL